MGRFWPTLWTGCAVSACVYTAVWGGLISELTAAYLVPVCTMAILIVAEIGGRLGAIEARQQMMRFDADIESEYLRSRIDALESALEDERSRTTDAVWLIEKTTESIERKLEAHQAKVDGDLWELRNQVRYIS